MMKYLTLLVVGVALLGCGKSDAPDPDKTFPLVRSNAAANCQVVEESLLEVEKVRAETVLLSVKK
jgi:hypothetical protein